MTNRVTAKQLVELIQGKELSTTEIFAAVKAAHPTNTMTQQELVIRLRSMIISPDVKSPSADGAEGAVQADQRNR